NERIVEKPGERNAADALPAFHVVFQRKGVRPNPRILEDFGSRLEGSAQHPQQRIQHDDRQDDRDYKFCIRNPSPPRLHAVSSPRTRNTPIAWTSRKTAP